MDRYIFGAKPEDTEDNVFRPSALPAVMVPTMAYVPLQFFDTLYEIEEGYARGTVFPELDKPFLGCDMK